MEIKISELQTLISQQKLAAQFQYGAFKDGFLAAWDILNTYLKMKEPKCENCNIKLNDCEIADNNGICDNCYQCVMTENNAERYLNVKRTEIDEP